MKATRFKISGPLIEMALQEYFGMPESAHIVYLKVDDRCYPGRMPDLEVYVVDDDLPDVSEGDETPECVPRITETDSGKQWDWNFNE